MKTKFMSIKTKASIVFFCFIFKCVIAQTSFQVEFEESSYFTIQDMSALNNGEIAVLAWQDKKLSINYVDTLGSFLRSFKLEHAYLSFNSENNKLYSFDNNDLLVTSQIPGRTYISKISNTGEWMFSKELENTEIVTFVTLDNGRLAMFHTKRDGNLQNAIFRTTFSPTGEIEKTIEYKRTNDWNQDIVYQNFIATRDDQNIVFGFRKTFDLGPSTESVFIKTDLSGKILFSTEMFISTQLKGLQIDAKDNIVVHTGSVIYKLDERLEFVWGKFMGNWDAGNQKSDKNFIVNNSNEIIVKQLTRFDNQSLGLAMTKLDEDGDELYSKLLLDGIHFQTNKMVNIGEGQLIDSRGFTGNSILRKLDKESEAEDCMSMAACFEILDINGVVQKDIPFVTKDFDFNQISDQEFKLINISKTLKHVCEPLDLPDPYFEIINDSMCFNSTLFVNPLSVYPIGYSSWQVLDPFNKVVANQNSKFPFFDGFQDLGVYQLVHHLEVAGCNYYDTSEFILLPPAEEILDSNPQICSGEQLSLDLTAFPISNIEWENGDSSVVRNFSEEGNYSITYVDEHNCQSSESFELTVKPLPLVRLAEDTTICEGEIFDLSFDAQFHDEFVWTPFDIDEQIEVDKPGLYIIEVVNSCGRAKDEIEVKIEDCEERIYVANSFSPNGDGVNDLLTIHSDNVDLIGLSIFDRWGNEVFNMRGSNLTWDGFNHNDQRMESGVFAFLLEYRGHNNPVINYKAGDVTIYK